jgi:carbonic anhydrase
MFDLVYRFDPTNTAQRKMPLNAAEACQLLMQGNQYFVDITGASGKESKERVIPLNHRTFGSGDGDIPAQAPFAAVLGCADARVPPEMVFGKGCNELFVVRVAGNVLGQESLGSMRYAVSHFPTLKLLVVLAHSKCGAVRETVDMYLEPRRYMEMATDYSLRCVEEQILVAVRVAAMSMEEVYGSQVIRGQGGRNALIETAVVLNAAWIAACLRQEFRTRFPDVGVVFGTYDLISRCVRLPLSPSRQPSEEERGLFTPPEDAGKFRQLALRMCSGNLVRSLIGERPCAA